MIRLVVSLELEKLEIFITRYMAGFAICLASSQRSLADLSPIILLILNIDAKMLGIE